MEVGPKFPPALGKVMYEFNKLHNAKRPYKIVSGAAALSGSQWQEQFCIELFLYFMSLVFSYLIELFLGEKARVEPGMVAISTTDVLNVPGAHTVII